MTEGRVLRIVGTMSGTSLDGVDAAVLETDGRQILGFGPTAYRPYSDREREVLRAALGSWDEEGEAAEVVESAHADLLFEFEGVDAVGFHGQTLAHEPKGRGTHQTGAGDVLAHLLGVPVVWDFRTADVAAGGEGAPLAPFFHWACARWAGLSGPVAFLNLGGVGNLTWVDADAADPAAPGALLAFDTGPANAPIDDLMRARLGAPRDEGGQIALTGEADAGIVDAFLKDPFFARAAPKSLDRDAFGGLAEAVGGLSTPAAVATLAQAAVAAVALGITQCPRPPAALYVTGGGRHNAGLMARLEAELSCPVAPVETLGLEGDMLEAQAFAYLAARVLRGLPITAPGTTGVPRPMTGGRVVRPGDPPSAKMA